MIREFFCGSKRYIAAAGLILIFSHAAVHAWLKYAVNEWYGAFYDILEDSGRLSSNKSVTNASWIEKQTEVSSSLLEFVKLACVSVLVMPVTKFVRSAWTMHWRICLMNAYIEKHNPNISPIEGMSQRIHEDSYRFAKGVELCLTTVLDAIVTLAVFIPLLSKLGTKTPCPASLSFFRPLGDGWLVGTAFASAFVGLFVTLLLGHRLVELEVSNQRVEAELRKDLVILESTPANICQAVPISPEETIDSANTILFCATNHFVPIIGRIYKNYMALFLNFGVLNLWLAIFDQFNVILPYAVFSPLLFDPDPASRITLGVLVQVSNSFDKVFGALSIISENWGAVNEFRSVLRRLGQYEKSLYVAVPQRNRTNGWCLRASDRQQLVTVEIVSSTITPEMR